MKKQIKKQVKKQIKKASSKRPVAPKRTVTLPVVETLPTERLRILKTYKLFIDGKFPRTESGRYYEFKGSNGRLLANVCLASRKDFRDAVVAARSGHAKWSKMSGYQRGQILYRIAEILESRKGEFIEELMLQGVKGPLASVEIDTSIDRLVYYAGWADKYGQIFSSVNPVNAPFFNFSAPEAIGVAAIIGPANSALLGTISVLAPLLAGGSSAVVLSDEKFPLSLITLGEVMATSDVPAGVVNFLSGRRAELLPHIVGHMDVDALIYCGGNRAELKLLQESASVNMKRCFAPAKLDWEDAVFEDPYCIMQTQEIKTTWHPVGL
jgi:acyl-CoA reductase-like NAD-dependent aldehyde dehydrogenase